MISSSSNENRSFNFPQDFDSLPLGTIGNLMIYFILFIIFFSGSNKFYKFSRSTWLDKDDNLIVTVPNSSPCALASRSEDFYSFYFYFPLIFRNLWEKLK